MPDLFSLNSFQHFSAEKRKTLGRRNSLKWAALAATIVKCSKEPDIPTKSCKARGSDLRVHFKLLPDGLARAEVSRAVDAGDVGIFGCSCIYCGLCFGVISDHVAYLRSWSCFDFSCYYSQLAFLQSSPSQLVGPK